MTGRWERQRRESTRKVPTAGSTGSRPGARRLPHAFQLPRGEGRTMDDTVPGLCESFPHMCPCCGHTCNTASSPWPSAGLRSPGKGADRAPAAQSPARSSSGNLRLLSGGRCTVGLSAAPESGTPVRLWDYFRSLAMTQPWSALGRPCCSDVFIYCDSGTQAGVIFFIFIFSDCLSLSFFPGFYLFIPFIFISWRLITLQYCSGFCHIIYFLCTL